MSPSRLLLGLVALAAAVLGDAEKVKYVPTTAKVRFTVLQSGEIDVLIRNGTWTQSREADLGLLFTGTNYYDGQGFMVRKKLNIASALELNGASVCVQQGSTTEGNLADWWTPEDAAKYKDIVSARERPTEAEPIPAGLDWEQWLGPAPFRPFHSIYFPGPKWYRWWDFGSGTMSDLGSHWNDLPFWALDLKAPLSIEA